MRRLLVAAIAAACGLPVATASAHEGNPSFRSDVHGLAPATDGVSVEVLNRDDRLLLTNRSDHTVLIEGYSGDPYARLLPDGTVQVNRNSAAAYLNAERDGQVPVPANAGGDAPPDWRTESRTGKFEWHDHRIHWMAEGTPPAVADEAKLTRVDDWTVPISVDGRRAEITGTLWWTPTAAALAAVLLAPARSRRSALDPGGCGQSAPLSGADCTDPPVLPAVALGAVLAFLVLVPGLGGHASTQSPTWAMLPANALHVLAVGLWAGGLVALVVALPAATRHLEPAQRTRLLAGVLTRFSPLALTAVAVLAVAGLVQAYVEARTLAHLLDTAFGRCVLIKAVLLGGLIAIGAWHRRRGLPRLRAIAAAGRSPAGAGVAVRRALRAEVGLIEVSRNGSPVTPRRAGLRPGNRAVLQATFARALPRGSYTVTWRARADDSHSQSGSWRFTVR